MAKLDLTRRAIRYKQKIGRRERIVLLECPICGMQWDVSNRGRETGFVAAAADNHSHGCSGEAKHESDR